MEFSVKHGAARKLKTACLVVGVYAGKTLGEWAADLDRGARGALARVVNRGDVSGKPGECLLLPDVAGIDAERVLLVGVGKREGLSPEEYVKLLGKAAEALKAAHVKNAVSTLQSLVVKGRDAAWVVEQHVLVFGASAYRYTEFKSKAEGGQGLARLTFLADEAAVASQRSAVALARAKLNGIEFMKGLANRPANRCTPTYLAEQAVALAEQHDKLTCTVLEEADMEELGMGALLSVARGSRQPAKLIVLEYRGAAKNVKPIVLVGKGVTFDSGGISLKPGPGMDEMKFDMCGAASVLGVMAALAEIAPKQNVIGVVPATENLPDGNASKPSDVVTSMSGQTIEILNTDAEGRLILCDALTYSARFEPAVVIDIATLTGACVVALGEHASGLFSNDDALADALLAAGQKTGDRAWRMPVWEDYQKQLDSPVADMANVGGRNGGAITAACFLARYTRNYRWAHLDIAGTAWGSGKNKYASGRPMPLLLEYILSQA